MKVSTLWLKDYVKFKVSPEEIAHSLTMSGLEVKAREKAGDGLVYETEITSNRPDWLSHMGVAREVSALYSTPLLFPETTLPEKLAPFPQEFSIEIKNHDLCPYYTGTILRGIKPCLTPSFIRKRLEAVGLRPINFLVDVTNFVLLECGQPLHAFDLKLIQGNAIIIRTAKAEETIVGIDGKNYKLEPKDLVIADANRAIAIAGVMGGKETEVSEATQDILLESAFFKPASVRMTSKRLGLSTDSSYRFERRVDPEGVEWARCRVIALILEYTKVGEITRVKSVGRKPLKRSTVLLPFEKIAHVLGADIAPAKVEKILKNLGIGILQKNKRFIKTLIPSFRADLVQPIDVIEEVARIYGYSRIPETLPMLATLPHSLDEKRKFEVINLVTDRLVGAGYWEVQNYSIIRSVLYGTFLPDSNQRVKIFNSQNQELDLMRPSLIPGLLESVQRNQYRGAKAFKFFETGHVYHAQGKELPAEKPRLGIAVYGHPDKTWAAISRELTIYDIKGALEFLMQTLGISKFNWKETSSSWTEEKTSIELIVEGKSAGIVGELSGEILKRFDLQGPVAIAEIELEVLMAAVNHERTCVPLTKFPPVLRDFSLLVPKELPAESVRATILSEGNAWLKEVRLFDVYEGKNLPTGVKSLAFNLEYQSDSRTLHSEEVQEEHSRIAKLLQERYNVQLPSARENA